MPKPDGGQAFPVAGLSGLPNDNWIDPGPGMTLRQWYAGKVITGLIANQGVTLSSCTDSGLAKRAFEIADYMIAESEKNV